MLYCLLLLPRPRLVDSSASTSFVWFGWLSPGSQGTWNILLNSTPLFFSFHSLNRYFPFTDTKSSQMRKFHLRNSLFALRLCRRVSNQCFFSRLLFPVI